MTLKHSALLISSSLLIFMAVLIGGCTTPAEVSNQIIKDVSAREAFDIIQKNQDNPNFVIIDVRTPKEYADGHIERAINVDFNSDDFRSKITQLEKEKAYLIYCRSGNRSSGALQIMTELDFVEVYHLSAGIIGWLDEGLPTVK